MEEEDEETRLARMKVEMMMRQDELMKRGERRDSLRRLMAERSKAEREDLLRRDREAREAKNLQARRDEKLGHELSSRKHADAAEEKRRQALRRDSIELRRLEDQLRVNRAAEAARAQLAEREIRRENARIREIEDARKIQALYQNESFERQQTLDARRRKDQYRRDLQGQLALNRRLRQRNSEERRHEGEIHGAEDLENQRRKRETAARLLAEEREFARAREVSRLGEKQRLLREDEERARVLRGQTDHAKAAAGAAKEKMLAKERMLARMTAKMMDDETRRREREEAVIELTAEEERGKLEDANKRALLARKTAARELWDDMVVQRLAIEERRAREAEADRGFADYLERERAKSTAADKRKDEERLARGIEYGKALREAIATRSIGYAAKILESQTMLNCDRKLDAARGISIEKERSRILEEHERRFQGSPKLD